MKKTLFLALFLSLIASSLFASSYFTVEWRDGRAWFKTPSGKPFISMGVNAIGDQSYRAPNDNYYNPVKNQFDGDKAAWIKEVFLRMKEWHFNTVGAWSDEDLEKKKVPYTHELYIARGNPWEDVLNSVFSDAFVKRVKENAQKAAEYKDDPNLIGYFLDNELPWWGDYGWKTDGQKTLLERYAAINLECPDKDALKAFFEDRYDKDIDNFNAVWETHLKSFEDLDSAQTLIPRTKKQKADANAWAGMVAERYFAVTTEALKKIDPNHLILGVRFAGEVPWEVVDACAKYCDVVSVNLYQRSGDFDTKLFDNFYARAKRPILVTEYSFAAEENQSGDPNKGGADVRVPTQADRAEHLDRYAHQSLNLPYIVGLHWFEWSDESPQGRFDGEACDYGLVDIHDKPYTLLTEKHTALNLLAADLHKNSTSPLPDHFEPAQDAQYRQAGAGMKIPNTRDFLRITSSAPVSTWGDDSHNGTVTLDLSNGPLAMDYDSGGGWGCGISCYPNVPPLLDKQAVDLTGYNLLVFEAFAPMGLTFEVFLTESGAKDLTQAMNGADGESYSFPSFTGTGHWQTYTVHFEDLELRTAFGNQKGNKILDLQGLSTVDFFIPGGQGSGRLILRNLQFRVR